MRLGALAGTGVDCCGNSLMSFTSHGWGYGLARADRPRDALLNLFTSSAHAQTRGTWTAPEEADISDGYAMPFAGPSQLAMPLFLKWALVWDGAEPGASRGDDDAPRAVWLGRAVPRAWLAAAGGVRVARVPTRFGRVGFAMRLVGAAAANVSASVPGAWATTAPPPGGCTCACARRSSAARSSALAPRSTGARSPSTRRARPST